MSELQSGDTQENATPAAAPTAEQTHVDSSAQASGGDTPSAESNEGSDHMIPKHRFDEVNNQLKELKRSFDESSAKSQKTDKTIDALRSALDGGSGTQVDGAVADIMKNHNLKGQDLKLVQDILEAAERKVSSKLEAEMKPLKSQQILAKYEKDFRELQETFPEASDLTSEEKKEFREMAFSKEFGNAPLVGVWKSFAFDKPHGSKKTLESSSSGRARSMGGEKSISEMSLDEFEEYSNSQAK